MDATLATTNGMTGVYIHIPFCKSRCLYCDFFSTTALARRKEYVNALLQEARARQHEMNDVQTVYFGGGTPSLLDIKDIEQLLHAVHSSEAKEITLEANPGDLTLDKLRDLRTMGINRLSIGVQSFNDTNLHLLGRRHSAYKAWQAVEDAYKAGFDNISIDLMYGLPNQTVDSWCDDLRDAILLDVQHLSCYCLSYEQNTPMTQMLQQGMLTAVDDDTCNMMYYMLCELSSMYDYEHYEISNFAKPHRRSMHNSGYWNHTPYVGLGAGAHSFDGLRTRRVNSCDLDIYITSPIIAYTEEVLTDTDLYNERIMLGLRTAEGITTDWLDPRTMDAANSYVEKQMLELSCGRLIATRQGTNLLNRIIEDLMI